MTRTIVAFVAWCELVGVPAQAVAADDETAVKVAERLGYDATGAYAVSEAWGESKTIVALAIPVETDEPADSEVVTYDLEVLVVDSATLSVRSRYRERKAIVSSAIDFTELSIDAEPVRLSSRLMAFGVRFRYQGSSQVNPFGATVLDLFVESGSRVKRVLHSLQVSSNGGQWDGRCAGSFWEVGRTVRVAKGVSNGFRDLVIEGERTERTTVSGADGECDETETDGKRERFTLRYDGKTYRVPKSLRYW